MSRTRLFTKSVSNKHMPASPKVRTAGILRCIQIKKIKLSFKTENSNG